MIELHVGTASATALLGQQLAPNETGPADVCNRDIFAREEDCPKSCPFAAELQDKFCHFKCVQGKQCGSSGTMTEATIADDKEHLCRRCRVEGCLTCAPSKPGLEDVEECEKCMPGYIMADGECKGVSDVIFLSIIVMAVILIVMAIFWYVNLALRPVVNETAVKYGLECRTRTKFCMPRSATKGHNQSNADAGGSAANTGAGVAAADGSEGASTSNGESDSVQLYPLSTNLCSFNFMHVAGPGGVFFFQFQAAILLWATVLWVLWLLFGFTVSTDLFLLGNKPAETPQKLCAVVQWGRARQMELVWVKVAWLALAYVFSFAGAMVFALRQKRQFREFDEAHTTQSDYAALVTMTPKTPSDSTSPGVLALAGDTMLEDSLKTCIAEATGEPLVGVSVCWDFHHHEHEVRTALEADVGSTDHSKGIDRGHRTSLRSGRSLELLAAASESPHAGEGEEPGALTRLFNWINKTTLKKWNVDMDTDRADTWDAERHEKTKDILHTMKSTASAFAVFPTKKACAQAVQAAQMKGGLEFSGGHEELKLNLEHATHEPESNLWEHFAIPDAEVNRRLFKGWIIMGVSILLWTVVLYLPYAHYMGSFSYANGDEPPEIGEIIFICLVVGAQVGLFVAASIVAEGAGLRYEDEKQRVYIILYNTALVLNLAMDMALTATLSYNQMTGRGVHVADGRLLSDLTSFQEIFESYPMQKSIGLLLLKYCWPATFFLPFFLEPFGICWLPYHIGLKFIGSDKKMTDLRAEKALELPIMEQGRYADVIFNAILVSVVPFIAPGYMHKIFGFFIFSHCWIYASDHWKVLRCVTRFYFAGHGTSCFAQKLFSIPCGIFLAALVFKANQMSGTGGLGSGKLQGGVLWGAMFGACFGHIILHVQLLGFMEGGSDKKGEEEDVEYSECAKETPATWFSCNPVHCLRSKHIYNHQPPHGYFVAGKEHLLHANPEIGAHFEGKERRVPEDLLGL